MSKIYLIIVLFFGPLFGTNVKMDLNAVYGSTNFHTIGVQKYANLVDKYTNGTVKIVVHPGSSLVKSNPLKAVKDGTVAMSDMFLPYTSGGGKIFGISALPFIAKSYEDAYRLYKISKPLYEQVAKKWNQKLLYSVAWPASGFYSKKEFKSIKDFKGTKTRTYDKNSAFFVKISGGNAVALPWGEVYTALRTGMVDSVITSSFSGQDGQLWEVLDYFTKINYAYPLQAVTVNLYYWNSLNKEQQKSMLKAAKEIEDYQWKAVAKEDRDALDTISKNGIKISESSDELNKELDNIASTILNEYLSDADMDIQNVFKEYRK